MQSAEMTSYLHRATGRVLTLSDEAFRAAEDDDEERVEPEELADARSVLAAAEEYLALPDRFDVDEYHMMERFASGLDDADARNETMTALRGRGAFRYFKDALYRLGLAPAWYAYRDNAYLDVARAWCEANRVEHDPQ